MASLPDFAGASASCLNKSEKPAAFFYAPVADNAIFIEKGLDLGIVVHSFLENAKKR
jgi:hypothetical protein